MYGAKLPSFVGQSENLTENSYAEIFQAQIGSSRFGSIANELDRSKYHNDLIDAETPYQISRYACLHLSLIHI